MHHLCLHLLMRLEMVAAFVMPSSGDTRSIFLAFNLFCHMGGQYSFTIPSNPLELVLD